MELIQEASILNKNLEQSLRMLKATGTSYAESERDYKITLSQEILKLRDAGMAVTLISQVVYGIKKVADARFKRDVAEATYKANMEAINVYKLQIRILENQIEREWNK